MQFISLQNLAFFLNHLSIFITAHLPPFCSLIFDSDNVYIYFILTESCKVYKRCEFNPSFSTCKHSLPIAYSDLRCSPWFPVFQADEVWEHHCLSLYCMLLPSCSRFFCCHYSGLPVWIYLAHKYVQPRSREKEYLLHTLCHWGRGLKHDCLSFPSLRQTFWNSFHRFHWWSWGSMPISFIVLDFFRWLCLHCLNTHFSNEFTLSSPLFLTLLPGKPRLNSSRIYLIHYSLFYNAVWVQLFFNWIVSIYYIKF